MARTTLAVLLLAALAASSLLPIAGLALGEERAAGHCARGRCCCSSGGTPRDMGSDPCLRRACGCGTHDAAGAATPASLEAVLPPAVSIGRAVAGPRSLALLVRTPSGWPQEPPVPPPRRHSLPA